MPSQEAITRTVTRYLWLVAKGTADDVVTLYASDATIDDPIGSDLRRGHDAIREFYAGFQDAKKESELAQLRVAGSKAAFLWHLTLDADDSRSRISPISVLRFGGRQDHLDAGVLAAGGRQGRLEDLAA